MVGCGGASHGEPALPFVCTSWALGALGGGGWAGGSPGSFISQALPVGWLPWCPQLLSCPAWGVAGQASKAFRLVLEEGRGEGEVKAGKAGTAEARLGGWERH